MARYTGPDCRLCRREKTKLFLKGAKCDSPKCPIEIRPYPPGEHGRNRPKENDYLLQLRETQKVKRIYGVLEKQFRNYYEQATRTRGRTGEALLQLLESRLDNVIYRTGIAGSRAQARQLVLHGHIRIKGKKVNIPSYLVNVGDEIELKNNMHENAMVLEARNLAKTQGVAPWLDIDPANFKAKVVALPRREDVQTPPMNEQLIVELYSK